jgi:hypothetical protein
VVPAKEGFLAPNLPVKRWDRKLRETVRAVAEVKIR